MLDTDRLSAAATGLTMVMDWFCCAPTDEELERLCALLSALCAKPHTGTQRLNKAIKAFMLFLP